MTTRDVDTTQASHATVADRVDLASESAPVHALKPTDTLDRWQTERRLMEEVLTVVEHASDVRTQTTGYGFTLLVERTLAKFSGTAPRTTSRVRWALQQTGPDTTGAAAARLFKDALQTQ